MIITERMREIISSPVHLFITKNYLKTKKLPTAKSVQNKYVYFRTRSEIIRVSGIKLVDGTHFFTRQSTIRNTALHCPKPKEISTLTCLINGWGKLIRPQKI